MSFGRKRSPEPQNLFQKVYDPDDKLTKTYEQRLKTSQFQIDSLTRQLLQPATAEVRQIESYKKTFFNRLKSAIDQGANQSLRQTQSDLAKRFGGSLNATFGTDLLAKIEKNRLQAIRDAQVEAAQVGREMYEDNQQSRFQKLQALMGLYDRHYNRLRDHTMLKETLNRQIIKPQEAPKPRKSLLSRVVSGVGSFLGKLL